MAISPLLYRTADNTRWGGGLGADLSAVQIDMNFWDIFQSLTALEESITADAGIDYFNVTGDQLYVHLTNHQVLGPYTLPTAEWHPRGPWQPLTGYLPFDVFDDNGSLYLVMIAHTSAATFNPNASSGPGLSTYKLLLTQPSNVLPAAGAVGQRLVKSTTSDYVTEWRSDHIRIAVTVLGQPDNGELVLVYPVVDNMTLPTALTGSNFAQGSPPEGNVSWTITHNNVFAGTIDFSASPEEIGVTFTSDVVCVPGDVIKLTAPTTADANQADVAFVLVATLN